MFGHVGYHNVFISHTCCGLATGLYAKNVSMSAVQTLAFTYHIAFMYLGCAYIHIIAGLRMANEILRKRIQN